MAKKVKEKEVKEKKVKESWIIIDKLVCPTCGDDVRPEKRTKVYKKPETTLIIDEVTFPCHDCYPNECW